MKGIKIALIVVTMLALCACWDYRSLDNVDIVTGIAIDRDVADENYVMTMEILNLSNSSKEGGLKTSIVSADGLTVFDGIRNAKSMLHAKPYFGSTGSIIISKDLASKYGIVKVLDMFYRDIEPRETMTVFISREDSAAQLLSSKTLDFGSPALVLKNIADEDARDTAATYNMHMYEVANVMYRQGVELTLPAISVVEQNGDKVNRVNGVAAFKENKLVGFLDAEETKFFLYIINRCKGGLFSFPHGDGSVTMEIVKVNTKRSYHFENGRVKIKLEPIVQGLLAVNEGDNDPTDLKAMEDIRKSCAKALVAGMQQTIQKVQKELDSDIFGFGGMIYFKDYKKWNSIRNDWDEMFRQVEVEIEPDIQFLSTGLTK